MGTRLVFSLVVVQISRRRGFGLEKMFMATQSKVPGYSSSMSPLYRAISFVDDTQQRALCLTSVDAMPAVFVVTVITSFTRRGP